MGLHYFHFAGDDYVAEFDNCPVCSRTPIAMQNIPNEQTQAEELYWICACGEKLRVYQHHDDCPCTLGGECELEGVYDESEYLSLLLKETRHAADQDPLHRSGSGRTRAWYGPGTCLVDSLSPRPRQPRRGSAR